MSCERIKELEKELDLEKAKAEDMRKALLERIGVLNKENAEIRSILKSVEQHRDRIAELKETVQTLQEKNISLRNELIGKNVDGEEIVRILNKLNIFYKFSFCEKDGFKKFVLLDDKESDKMDLFISWVKVNLDKFPTDILIKCVDEHYFNSAE